MPQLSFDQLCKMIWEDPISAAPTIQNQHRSYRHRKYELAVAGYVLASSLIMSPELIEAFYGLPFFEGGFKRNSANLLLHCLQFIYEDRSGSDSDRAGEHARALQGPWDAGAHPNDVLQKLKSAGGFSGLQSADAPSALPVAQPMPMPRNESRWSQHLTEDDLDRESTSPPPSKPRPSTEGQRDGSKAKKLKPLTAKEIIKNFLLVDVGPLDEDHIVFEMEVGERRQMLLERLPEGPDQLARYKGTLDPPR